MKFKQKVQKKINLNEIQLKSSSKNLNKIKKKKTNQVKFKRF